MMNKKADVGYTIRLLVGLIAAALLIAILWPFGKSAYASITKKGDASTINSLGFLFEEIDELADGEVALIPYDIAEGHVLVSGVGGCPTTSLCICKDKECSEFLKGGIKNHFYFTFDVTPVIGTKERGIKNVRIERNGDKIIIRDTYAAKT